MSQDESPTHCVYTIVNHSVIDSAFEHDGAGEFEERSRWVGAAKHFASLDDDEVYLLLFANAASIVGVQWIASIEEIELLEHGTRVKFSSLLEVSPGIPLDSLRKASNGQPLNPSYIRPYVPCLIDGDVEEAVWDVIDEQLNGEENSLLAEIEFKTITDYIQALSAIERNMTQKQRLMLVAHAEADGKKLSMRALADIADYSSHGTGNMQYGALGRKFANFFKVSGLPNQTQAMAWGNGEPDEKGHFAWTLREPLAEALYELGWLPRPAIPDLRKEAAA